MSLPFASDADIHYTMPKDGPSCLPLALPFCWKDQSIDEKMQFYGAMRRLEDPLTRNFVLDFGNDDAWCASDLDTDELKLLFSKPVCLT